MENVSCFTRGLCGLSSLFNPLLDRLKRWITLDISISDGQPDALWIRILNRHAVMLQSGVIHDPIYSYVVYSVRCDGTIDHVYDAVHPLRKG